MTKEATIDAMNGHSDVQMLYNSSMYNIKVKNVEFYKDFFTHEYGDFYYQSIGTIDAGITLLERPSVTFGSDPELFVVSKDNEMVPSQAVLDKDTVMVKKDGFQIELNPNSHSCRQSSATYINYALQEAHRLAQAKGYKLSFKVGHIVSDDVWSKVSMMLKRFGCNPTVNAHEKNFKRVTGLRERFRAGGGHIHLGFTLKATSDVNKLVTLMDIMVGNTFVLLDRDPDNARRRKNYGRAGEYRLKSYGLEYRVLSNFWMKKYVLWSTATGLLRQAIEVFNMPKLADDLLSRVDIKKVRDAINNNDKDLAMENFMAFRQFILDNKIVERYGAGLSFNNIDLFLDWAKQDDPIAELNIDTNEKILSSWYRQNAKDNEGLEQFLSSRAAYLSDTVKTPF